MDKRTETAIEVLKAGGYFRNALEWTWRREQFKTRLRTADGQIVKGVGEATRHALEVAGKLQRRECAKSSTYGQEWILR